MSHTEPLAETRSAGHTAALQAAAAGDMADATRLLREAVLEVNGADLLNDLAVTRQALGMRQDAETLLRAALLIDPKHRDAQANLPRLAAPRVPSIQSGVLVSLCNGGVPVLGLVDPDTLAFERIDLLGHLPALGVTGLAAQGDRVYAVLHNLRDPLTWLGTSQGALMVLDRATLRLISQYPMRGHDVHSVAVLDDTVYAVSTGTDEVIALDMDGDEVRSERVFWRPDNGLDRNDHHHLNAIAVHEGDLLVCGFGRKADGDRWSAARDGFIYNITREREVVRGIYQPHSVISMGGGLGYCESPLLAARLPDGRSAIDLPGYCRGLCAIGDKLYIATSQGRRRSKSTGEINNPSATGIPSGSTGVFRLNSQDLTVEAGIDLGLNAPEIYDLMAWKAAA